MPRSLSAFSLSRTQAYLKELFPIFKNRKKKNKSKFNIQTFIKRNYIEY